MGLLSLTTGSCLRIVIPTFPHQLNLLVVGQSQPVYVTFYEEDQFVVGQLSSLVQRSLQKASQMWGKLEHPIHVRIFPTHVSLEQAVNRQYRWLRAWAMFDQLYLQSPRTWHPRQRSSLPKLLVHELTHVIMFQQCCSSQNWFRQHIPFWFREGMASVTAEQGTWRMSRMQLRELLQSDWGKVFWQNPSKHLDRSQREAYSLAHWMFVDLMRWCRNKNAQGTSAILQLLQHMKQGHAFASAFQHSCGVSLAGFRERFLQHALSAKQPLLSQR